jgi:hypothetical protein
MTLRARVETVGMAPGPYGRSRPRSPASDEEKLGMSADEYSIASTIEGGYDAHLEIVNAAANRLQGALFPVY